MSFGFPTIAPAKDRRVRRSRSALMEAAIDLVTERDTAAVPLSDIAEAADVSRQLVYHHFGDRDSLLLEAAYDLARRGLIELDRHGADRPSARERTVAVARHFAEHRPFYRAVLNSPCGSSMNKALTGLFLPFNRASIKRSFPDALGEGQAEDLAVFLTGGAGAFFNSWLTDTPDPLDPERFADRLMALISHVLGDPGR